MNNSKTYSITVSGIDTYNGIINFLTRIVDGEQSFISPNGAVTFTAPGNTISLTIAPYDEIPDQKPFNNADYFKPAFNVMEEINKHLWPGASLSANTAVQVKANGTSPLFEALADICRPAPNTESAPRKEKHPMQDAILPTDELDWE